jgi:Arm DNA-binding domain
MRVKLTDSSLRSYHPRANQYVIGDSSCPGLCIRITPAGVKSFVFTYRNKATRKVTGFAIGRYPDMALTHAREIANEARRIAAKGGTPLAPRFGGGTGTAEKN